MSFDFDTPVERRGSGSYKWDEPLADGAPGDFIPLWVADMDFPTAPAVRRAVEQRAATGIFGYTHVDESYYQAVISWFSRRHGWTIDRADILYTSGVVPALSCTVKALTMPGEQVLVLSPVYNCFFSSIRNNGCQVLECPLVYEDATYHIDWEAFEACCAQEKTTLFLLCNPHNPAGRVWTPEELERMNGICLRHGVAVCSDEIHCELVMPGYRFAPFAAVSSACRDNAVVLNSPSKSFNTAGLQIANFVVHDPEWRRRIERAVNINEVCDVNPFGPVALKAAYNEGGDWLDALCAYIKGNYDLVCDFFSREVPAVKVTRLEGTYLAWLDVRGLALPGLAGHLSESLAERLLSEARVMLSPGTLYGKKTGEGFLRLNLATQRSRLAEALRRMAPVMRGA
ncbi:MAG: pyridoxal phosphate-dependent aminotransferase [Bacteroidales bacterium]|nr:pyridoxal phosphate-dependent aminotransferase [Bacteroidales bacterium]